MVESELLTMTPKQAYAMGFTDGKKEQREASARLIELIQPQDDFTRHIADAIRGRSIPPMRQDAHQAPEHPMPEDLDVDLSEYGHDHDY